MYLIDDKNILFVFDLFNWGLGIGDCAQSPIPNPQSPIPILFDIIFKIFLNKLIYLKFY